MDNLTNILSYAIPAGVLLIIFARKKLISSNKNVKNISGNEASSLISENKNFLILDVRTKGEFSGGHIPGALNIPVQELSSRIGELKKYTDQPVMVYCASGGRSPGAVSTLLKNNFKNIYHLNRGISSWSGKIKR